VAFQSRRFWEEDEAIYGGIRGRPRDHAGLVSLVRLPPPSGILLGAYIWSDELGEAFGKLTPAERLETALASGERLHPQYRGEVGRGLSVCWEKIPFSEGAWAE